jgi:serine/threonine protein kinase
MAKRESSPARLPKKKTSKKTDDNPASPSKFVGRGSYGCVYKPPVRCQENVAISKTKNKSDKSLKKAVSKVFLSEDVFNEESKLNDLINELDPKNLFTIPIMKACTAHLMDTPQDADVKCQGIFDSRKKKQLIMPDGGKNFTQIASDPKNYGKASLFVKIFYSMGPIFDGLATIASKGYVHTDVKPDNLLFDGTKSRLIDFGLLTKGNELYRDHNASILNWDYVWYPAEFKQWENVSQIEDPQEHSAVMNYYLGDIQSAVRDNMEKGSMQKGFNYDTYIAVHKHMGVNAQDSMKIFASELTILQNTGVYKYPDIFAHKVDSYSLGMSLLVCMCNMRLLPALINPSTPKAMRMTLQIIMAFLINIVDLNPFTRPTVATAADSYKRIISILAPKKK